MKQTIAKMLKMYRKYEMLSGVELSKKLGITPSHLCAMESGDRNISLKMLVRYSDIFGFTLSNFFYILESCMENESDEHFAYEIRNFWLTTLKSKG